MDNPVTPSFFDLEFKNSVAIMEFDNRYKMTVIKNHSESFDVQVLNTLSNTTEGLFEDVPYDDVDVMIEYLFGLKEPLRVLH